MRLLRRRTAPYVASGATRAIKPGTEHDGGGRQGGVTDKIVTLGQMKPQISPVSGRIGKIERVITGTGLIDLMKFVIRYLPLRPLLPLRYSCTTYSCEL